jgi:hypothetical protein
MRLAKSLLAAAAMAMACGAAYAADGKERKGFNDMDTNDDGKLSRAEAAGNETLVAKWKELDTDNDNHLSRTEYLTEMTRQDVAKVRERVSRIGGSTEREGAATGATAQPAPQSQRK